MKKRLVLSVCLLTAFKVYADPVNVNIAAPVDIAESLYGVNLELAEQISMYCEVETCRGLGDLLNVPGMSPVLLYQIEADLLFDIHERGMDLNNDC